MTTCPMPPFQPRQSIPAPAPDGPGLRSDPRPDRLARGIAGGRHVVELDLHRAGEAQPRVVALPHDRDDDIVSNARVTRPGRSGRPRRTPDPVASWRSGRSGSRPGPTPGRTASPVHSPAPLSTAPPADTGRAHASPPRSRTVTPVRAVPRPVGGAGSSRTIVVWPSPTPETSSTELVGPWGRVPTVIPKSARLVMVAQHATRRPRPTRGHVAVTDLAGCNPWPSPRRPPPDPVRVASPNSSPRPVGRDLAGSADSRHRGGRAGERHPRGPHPRRASGGHRQRSRP